MTTRVAGQTYRFTFTTAVNGVPTVLAGSPVISVYKNADTGQSTAGVTLTVSFDSVVGLNLVEIDTSADGTFYSAGADFDIVITTGTVGGLSVVGTTVQTFGLEYNWAEPGQGAPAATTTIIAKINYLYKAWRNLTTQTSAQYSLYNDAGNVIDQKAAFSDDATTASRGEIGTGP